MTRILDSSRNVVLKKFWALLERVSVQMDALEKEAIRLENKKKQLKIMQDDLYGATKRYLEVSEGLTKDFKLLRKGETFVVEEINE